MEMKKAASLNQVLASSVIWKQVNLKRHFGNTSIIWRKADDRTRIISVTQMLLMYHIRQNMLSTVNTIYLANIWLIAIWNVGLSQQQQPIATQRDHQPSNRPCKFDPFQCMNKICFTWAQKSTRKQPKCNACTNRQWQCKYPLIYSSHASNTHAFEDAAAFAAATTPNNRSKTSNFNEFMPVINKLHTVYPAIGKRSARNSLFTYEDKFYMDHHRATRHGFYNALEKYLSAYVFNHFIYSRYFCQLINEKCWQIPNIFFVIVADFVWAFGHIVRYRMNGTTCVLKTLCEVGQKRDENEPGTFLAEIIRIVFRWVIHLVWWFFVVTPFPCLQFLRAMPHRWGWQRTLSLRQ